ncbi:MAG: hypothetical protein Q8S94_13980 [Pseudohongiella sp.]|nr:hypothetical protein [Pseudohongiella sp.]
MRPWLLVTIFIILCLLDAGMTVYLQHHFPLGRELNPYVDPTSWTGILLAPAKWIVYGLFLTCLLLAEKRVDVISAKNGLLTDAALLAYIPLFLIGAKMLAVSNNLMPMIGVSTPISYVLAAMENIPGDKALHYTIFWMVFFLLMAPLGLLLIKRIYRYRC